MGSAPLLELLQNVANGLLTADDAVVQLEGLVTPLPPGSDDEGPPPAETAASLAKADFPEVVWGEGKSASHLVTSLQRIADRQGVAAATRVPPEVAAEVAAELPAATYNEAAATLVLKSTTKSQQKLPGTIAIIAAGTANARVVEECRVMLSSMGCYSFKLPESGVMGMHRRALLTGGSGVGGALRCAVYGSLTAQHRAEPYGARGAPRRASYGLRPPSATCPLNPFLIPTIPNPRMQDCPEHRGDPRCRRGALRDGRRWRHRVHRGRHGRVPRGERRHNEHMRFCGDPGQRALDQRGCRSGSRRAASWGGWLLHACLSAQAASGRRPCTPLSALPAPASRAPLHSRPRAQVALPTSVGYGTAFGGVAPLLGALNSSAPGVTVVNIDSGFGAAMAAWRSLKAAAKIRAAVLQAAGR
jgi:NCAIR mutase (PurE)-related protein